MTRCADCGKPLEDSGHELVVTDEDTGTVLVDNYPVCADCWEGDL